MHQFESPRLPFPSLLAKQAEKTGEDENGQGTYITHWQLRVSAKSAVSNVAAQSRPRHRLPKAHPVAMMCCHGFGQEPPPRCGNRFGPAPIVENAFKSVRE
jgi:hypothetical protein